MMADTSPEEMREDVSSSRRRGPEDEYIGSPEGK